MREEREGEGSRAPWCLGLAALGGLGAGPVERRGQLGLLDWALPLLSFFFNQKEIERKEKDGGVGKRV